MHKDRRGRRPSRQINWPTYGLRVKRPPPSWEFCQESQGDCHDTHDCKRLAKRPIGDPRTKPDTSICVLGNFADRDVFIATHCALREDLGEAITSMEREVKRTAARKIYRGGPQVNHSRRAADAPNPHREAATSCTRSDSS